MIGTPADYDNYISIKVEPDPKRCCCFHCWPETWAFVNKFIYPYGPLKDEGDVLININNEKFVLECHESGPEVVAYLGLGTASILLTKSIIELIVAMLKSLEKEKHKRPSTIKIIKRRQMKGKVKEENIISIDLPLRKDVIKKLNDSIKESLKEK